MATAIKEDNKVQDILKAREEKLTAWRGKLRWIEDKENTEDGVVKFDLKAGSLKTFCRASGVKFGAIQQSLDAIQAYNDEVTRSAGERIESFRATKRGSKAEEIKCSAGYDMTAHNAEGKAATLVSAFQKSSVAVPGNDGEVTSLFVAVNDINLSAKPETVTKVRSLFEK